MGKLFCLFFVLFLIILIQNKCDKEGFFGLVYNPKKCVDDKNWYVDSDAGKKTCKDIGKDASCYDRDAVGREGWERCQKTCGNCANTKVTKAPMGILAGFSGDPYEDFGVVLHRSKDRQWVGKTTSNKDDIRKFIDDKKNKEINNLKDRLDSLQSVTEMITGNVVKCDKDVGTKCNRVGGETGYKGCSGECFTCSPPKKDENKGGKKDRKKDGKKGKHSYIKQVDGNIQFPAVTISCEGAAKFNEDHQVKTPEYLGCYADNKGPYGHTDMFRALSGKHYKLTVKEQKMSLEGRRDACNRECQGFKYMGLQSEDDCFCGDKYEYFEDKNARKARRGGMSSKDEGDWDTITPDKQTGEYNKTDSIKMCGGKGTITCGAKNEQGGCCAHGGQNGNTCDWSNAVFKVVQRVKSCDNYFLFDKILDKDGKKGEKEKDKRITLGDMCPKECHKNVCKP